MAEEKKEVELDEGNDNDVGASNYAITKNFFNFDGIGPIEGYTLVLLLLLPLSMRLEQKRNFIIVIPDFWLAFLLTSLPMTVYFPGSLIDNSRLSTETQTRYFLSSFVGISNF